MAKTVALARGADDDEESGITELEKFDPERIDGVGTPANGFPVLMIKSADGAPEGDTMPEPEQATEPEAVVKDDGDRDGDGENAEPGDKDTGPDTGDGADAAEKSAGDATGPVDEAAEETPAPPLDPDPVDLVKAASPADRDAYLEALATYRGDEPVAKSASTGTEYLQAKAHWRDWSAFGEREGLDGTEAGARRWLAKHGTGPVPPPAAPAPVAEDEPVVIPSPEAIEALFKAEAEVYKRDIDTATRRKLASEHKALPDGSYPIETAGDLDNAARLARSGHGNVSGAKALIRRRAAELGVSNPLDDNNQTKKDAAEDNGGGGNVAEAPEAAEKAKSDGDADDAPKGKKCPTCKGSGKIRGGNVTCPKCKGKGVIKPGKAAKTAEAATAAVKAAREAGLLTEEAAAELIAQIESEAAKSAGPGARPVPASTPPVPEHREPDGPYVEGLEHDAGLPTDADDETSNVPSSVAALAMKAPYEVQRMHDALCAAYDAGDVLATYPAMKGVADAVDVDVFAKEAVELLRAGEYGKAGSASALAAVAKQLLAMPPAAVADGRALVHKSFRDMYPDTRITPQSGIKPGSYTRPYLSAGHAAPNSGGWTVNVPPSAHVPEPQDYQRGYLSAGHASPSPADRGPNNPSPPGSSGNEYYSTAEKDMAAAAMRSMHDHLVANYAGSCPMAPARHVMPPGMGATSAPETTMPRATGGVATVGKAAGEDMGGSPAPDGATSRKIKGNKGSGNKKILKTLERALRNAGTNLLGPSEVEAIIAAKLAPIMEAHNTQVADLTKQVEELGAQPDPAMAPVRGQMARAQDAPAAPVEKRSLIDEEQARRLAAQRREEADFADYVLRMSKSGDPKTREAAYAVLDGMSARDGDAA